MPEHDSHDLLDHGGDCPWCGHKSTTAEAYMRHDDDCPERPRPDHNDDDSIRRHDAEPEHTVSLEGLRLHIDNDAHLHSDCRRSVGWLLRVIDRASDSLAASRAGWHDDPTRDDHAMHHAPADVQIPKAVRVAVACELVRYWAAEGGAA